MPANRTPNTIKAAPISSSVASRAVETDEADDRWEARRWARGFLGLWVASAVIWVAMVALFAFSDLHSTEHLELTAWALIPPACTLAIVLALVWIRRGFRTRVR